jgi:hypothetical protein
MLRSDTGRYTICSAVFCLSAPHHAKSPILKRNPQRSWMSIADEAVSNLEVDRTTAVLKSFGLWKVDN